AEADSALVADLRESLTILRCGPLLQRRARTKRCPGFSPRNSLDTNRSRTGRQRLNAARVPGVCALAARRKVALRRSPLSGGVRQKPNGQYEGARGTDGQRPPSGASTRIIWAFHGL